MRPIHWLFLILIAGLLAMPLACANDNAAPSAPVTVVVVATPVPGGSLIYLFQWGTPGIGNGQFTTLGGMAVDSAGYIYTTEIYGHRVQKFDSQGNFILKWGRNGGDGSSGSANGEFSYPFGVAVDAAGNVYVADSDNVRVQKFTSIGGYLTNTSGVVPPGDSLSFPDGLALDNSGYLYVSDYSKHRITKYNGNTAPMTFMTIWGKNGADGTSGLGNGEFNGPEGVAVSPTGEIYVADTLNHRIQKFTSNGAFLGKWGKNFGDGTSGTGNGEFNDPGSIAFDLSGNLFVTDALNNRVQKFTSSGAFLGRWGRNGGDGSAGSGHGEFNAPFGIALDTFYGNLYVGEMTGNRIQKFSP